MSRMGYNYNQFYGKWSFFHAAINVGGLLVILLEVTSMDVWMYGVSISFLIYLYHVPRFTEKVDNLLSYANWVTLFRLVLTMLLAFSFHHLEPLMLFSGFLLVTSSDALDGYLARKYKQCTVVGENFDMETDAFMVFLLSYIHYLSGELNWWILIPGGLRYYSEILLTLSKKTMDNGLPKKIRSTIAVFFFISLLLPFILSNEISSLLIITSSFAICLSFLFSTVLSYQRFVKSILGLFSNIQNKK